MDLQSVGHFVCAVPRTHLYHMAKPQNCLATCEGSNPCRGTRLKYFGPRTGTGTSRLDSGLSELEQHY